MKILLIVHQCEPNVGREQGCGWNWSIQMARFGYEIVALTQKSNQSKIDSVLAELGELKNLKFLYVEDYRLISFFLEE